jgi:prevent-host-death family protein
MDTWTKWTKSYTPGGVDAVPIHEAKTHFSRLIARVEAGEEIVVRRDRHPVAKIVAYRAPTTPRTPGALKGQIVIADDFDETPADFAAYTA